jgi:invasion protein IalB
MTVRIGWARTSGAARAWAFGLAGALVVAGISAAVYAQAPAPPPAAPAPKAAPQPKAQPKAAPQAAAPTQPAAPDVPPLSYSPWTKVCLKGEEANAKQVCFTGKEGRLDTGLMVIGAVLIEPEGSPQKILRITLPLGMQLQQGTRIIVDQGQPMNAPYLICFPNGCMADYEASGELIGKFKKGQSMVVQAINGQGTAVSLPLPLPDFAKAYDGPPTDPKVVEDRQKKLQEEINKKQQLLQQQQTQQAPK